MNINEHLTMLINHLHSEQERDYVLTTANSIDKHLSTIKSLIKKVIDNKDVFEGRFRKLQSLLIASRGEQMICALSVISHSRCRFRKAAEISIGVERVFPCDSDAVERRLDIGRIPSDDRRVTIQRATIRR
jgi:hypothetical protein